MVDLGPLVVNVLGVSQPVEVHSQPQVVFELKNHLILRFYFFSNVQILSPFTLRVP